MHMIHLLIALTGNQIGAAGATQLANALQRNSTLAYLSGMIMSHSTIMNIMSFQLLFCVGDFGANEKKRVAHLLKRNKQAATQRQVCKDMMVMVTVW